jgi:molybdopterin-guanine dinucleotide biosynthesis protein
MSTVVAIAGLSSNVGKTTLVCALLERLRAWEAIKVTKGHYRSCGKDPHACCVSHLLADEPLVMSDRRATDVAGKDTGRYWGAGASNVHWVVATRKDVEEGVRLALARVGRDALGVVVEGTGFLKSIPVDLSVMVVPDAPGEIKASALAALPHVDYLYVSGSASNGSPQIAELARLLAARGVAQELPPVVNLEGIATRAATLEARRHGPTASSSLARK